MQCYKCEGQMKAGKREIRQDGITFDVMKCQECGEEVVTMKQLDTLASQYRKLRDAREITFAKWGNSIALRVPRDVAKEYGIHEGSHGMLMKEKGKISIIPG